MKINLDRLCKLAGVPAASNNVINEASNRSYHEDPGLDKEREVQFSNQLNEEAEEDASEAMHRHMEEEEGAHEGAGHDHMSELYAEEEGDDASEMMHQAMEEGEGHYAEGEGHYAEGSYMEEEEGDDASETLDPMDEVIEVDEAMLVQELRRARAMLKESAQRKAKKEEPLTESDLRRVVAEEVQNLMKDLNLTGGWVYGEDKPKNVHRGKVHTAFPGIGFRNSK